MYNRDINLFMAYRKSSFLKNEILIYFLPIIFFSKIQFLRWPCHFDFLYRKFSSLVTYSIYLHQFRYILKKATFLSIHIYIRFFLILYSLQVFISWYSFIVMWYDFIKWNTLTSFIWTCSYMYLLTSSERASCTILSNIVLLLYLVLSSLRIKGYSGSCFNRMKIIGCQTCNGDAFCPVYRCCICTFAYRKKFIFLFRFKS